MTKNEFREMMDRFWEEFKYQLEDEPEPEKPTYSTAYEEAVPGEPWYFVNVVSKAVEGGITRNGMVSDLYIAGNYYNDFAYAEKMAFEESLIRRLRRFAAQSAAHNVERTGDRKYLICWDYDKHKFDVGAVIGMNAVGEVLFDTEAAAREAIIMFEEELLTYFGQEEKAEELRVSIMTSGKRPCEECGNYEKCYCTDSYRDRVCLWREGRDCFVEAVG